MKSKKTVVINCNGTGSIPLEKLEDFQGRLKYLPDDNFQKLKTSILNNGFKIPIFTWKHKIMDGHQRVTVLKQLKVEGYEIPEIPVVELKNEKEEDAKKTVLLLNSRYGIINEQGFYDFAQEFELADIIGEIEIPEIQLSEIKDSIKDVEIEGEKEDDGFIIKVFFDSKRKFDKARKILNLKGKNNLIKYEDFKKKVK